VSKKKSSTKRGERNPIFNEAMIFSVPAHALQVIKSLDRFNKKKLGTGQTCRIGLFIVCKKCLTGELCNQKL